MHAMFLNGLEHTLMWPERADNDQINVQRQYK